MKLAELRREIQVGIEQADRGELHDAEVVFADLRRRARRAINSSSSFGSSD